ncbi:MAG: ferritin-like protein of unknown function [Gammaproteobacteria bacterium]|jgi:rubrerythrin|nr:ferritin-like protein of unknown function [Gammaproteobacteria bacterium]
MNNQEIVNKLSKLIQLDIDASEAYKQALQKIDHMAIHTSICQFREDHLRHIDNLSAIIQELGGKVPDYKQDLKGYLIEGFTALRSVTGTEGALKAMQGNEKLTNRVYKEATSLDLPVHVMQLVQQNYADEQRHLRYIEQVLETKPWATKRRSESISL